MASLVKEVLTFFLLDCRFLLSQSSTNGMRKKEKEEKGKQKGTLKIKKEKRRSRKSEKIDRNPRVDMVEIMFLIYRLIDTYYDGRPMETRNYYRGKPSFVFLSRGANIEGSFRKWHVLSEHVGNSFFFTMDILDMKK